MPAVLYGSSKDLVSRVLHVQVLDVTDAADTGKEETKTINAVTIRSDKPSHGRNFETVYWKGVMYSLTPMQRPVIRALWEAWRTPHKFVSGAELLEAAGGTGDHVSDIFKGHPAWKTLIVNGSARGGPLDTYCLND